MDYTERDGRMELRNAGCADERKTCIIITAKAHTAQIADMAGLKEKCRLLLSNYQKRRCSAEQQSAARQRYVIHQTREGKSSSLPYIHRIQFIPTPSL